MVQSWTILKTTVTNDIAVILLDWYLYYTSTQIESTYDTAGTTEIVSLTLQKQFQTGSRRLNKSDLSKAELSLWYFLLNVL